MTFKMSPSTRDVSQSCSAHDWAAERRHSTSQCCGSQARAAHLEGCNRELRDALHSALTELEEARALAHTLQRLQQQLQVATP